MNEMDYGPKELRCNVINEVDNVTREELRLSDYVMMCCKPITEHQTPANFPLKSDYHLLKKYVLFPSF